jgi:peroxiredoxin
MAVATLIARLGLCALFLVAGVAKLWDRAGTRRSIVAFGMAERLAAPLSILVPVAELIVAGLLLPVAFAWVGAVGALALLVVFSTAIAVNLAMGREPDCHCFGQIHATPAGWPALIRNAIFTALAGFVAYYSWDNSGISIGASLAELAAMNAVIGFATGLLIMVVTVEAILIYQLLRQQGRLLLRLDSIEGRSLVVPGEVRDQATAEAPAGLAIGAPAPRFQLPDTQGGMASLDALLASGKALLLFFTNPRCGSCSALMPEMERKQQEHADWLRVVVVTESREEAASNHLPLLLDGRAVAHAYQAYGTPAAVLIRPDGYVGSTLALGADGIRALIEDASRARSLGSSVPRAPEPSVREAGDGRADRSTRIEPVILRVGDPVPSLKLKDIDGKHVELADLHGRRALLIFWNPACHFCQKMLPDVQALETTHTANRPKLVLVSSGSVEANRAMGLGSTIVIDDGFQVGSAFGARGTPMGVLLNEDGTIASDVVAGGMAVLALAADERAVPTEPERDMEATVHG